MNKGPRVNHTVKPESPGSTADSRRIQNTRLNDNLKSNLENTSGTNMSEVRVQYNSSRPAQLQTSAYTQGSHIHVAPGKGQHLAHETAHVVQQNQGQVPLTSKVNGAATNDNPALEKEADVLGAKTFNIGRKGS